MARFLGNAPQGIVVEVGVWRGGSIGYLAERFPDRKFYGFDTFEGMPPICDMDNHHKAGDFGDTSFEFVRDRLNHLPNVRLVKGIFPDSDVTDGQPVALAHIDVDIYMSTYNSFHALKRRIVRDGRMYCDDAFQNTCEGATLALCQFAVDIKKIPQFDLGSHACFCF